MKQALWLLFMLALLLPTGAAQSVRVSGSTSLYPVTMAMAEEFSIDNPRMPVAVGFSGTGGGLSRLCRGALDIVNASRVITPEELRACAENGVGVIELPVAADAITLVVNPENEFVHCLSLAELHTIWGPAASAARWSDVRPGWSDAEITLFGPGVDSGTFAHFTEAVNGSVGAVRTDFFPSGDDNVLVRGVEGEPYALGYFGYAYYALNRGRVRAVAVDGGAGCVEPTPESMQSGSYAPLSRPLFLYVSSASLATYPVVGAFLNYYLSPASRGLISEVGFVPLEGAVYEAAGRRLSERVLGSAFQGFKPGDSVLERVRLGVSE